MDALKILIDGMLRNRTLFVLLLGFGLFPIYTGMADLPFWNDLAMRIMLLGMAMPSSMIRIARSFQKGRSAMPV